jgi:hypothetical protein
MIGPEQRRLLMPGSITVNMPPNNSQVPTSFTVQGAVVQPIKPPPLFVCCMIHYPNQPGLQDVLSNPVPVPPNQYVCPIQGAFPSNSAELTAHLGTMNGNNFVELSPADGGPIIFGPVALTIA